MPRHVIARALIVAATCIGLVGCAQVTQAPSEPIAPLLQDDAFAPPAQPVRPEQILAMSPAMVRYVDDDIARRIRRQGRQQGLIDALYDRDMLRLEYDSAVTRTASEAFEARSGNCLSLVIMTAALARHLELPVVFQSVDVEESWTRGQALLLASGHVNLVLSQRPVDKARGVFTDPQLTVDFLPPQDLQGRRVTRITEDRVLAMYMNNRAAETMAHGDLDQAYAWARASLKQDPSFASAPITLGVIYHRKGLLAPAEAAFRHALRAEPQNTIALADLASVLVSQGRQAEADEVKRALAQLEAFPPFHFFDLGKAAVQRGDFEAGKVWLQREMSRDPDYHEVHFWLAVAYNGLGDAKAARKHLSKAMANSTTRGEHDLYAAKLDRLQARTAH
ncbi:tetratricopeptide repeat protein [Ideonella sp. DXS29W]|uniref:Tetratricopeptide repeat protein n=1 Tax=Ideonella lacteola TaxID=2984193 RepID=A0ABU9BQ80_9BURK